MSEVKSLRQEHAEATRSSVLAAARDLFATVGYAATSIDQIAASARVTKGAVYHHFENKTALFRGVYEELAAEVEQRVRRRIAPATSPLERAMLAVEAFLQCADDAQVRTIMFRDGMPVLTGECRVIDERHYLGLLRDLLAELAAAGLLVDVDTAMLARMLLSVLIEGSAILGQAEDIDAARASVRAALHAILGGLLRT